MCSRRIFLPEKRSVSSLRYRYRARSRSEEWQRGQVESGLKLPPTTRFSREAWSARPYFEELYGRKRLKVPAQNGHSTPSPAYRLRVST